MSVRVYVCMCVSVRLYCMRVCVYVCMCVCVHVCTYVYVPCPCVNMYACDRRCIYFFKSNSVYNFKYRSFSPRNCILISLNVGSKPIRHRRV